MKKQFEAPELGPVNVAPRAIRPMFADDHWHSQPWFDAPRDDPSVPEVHTYTDHISYDPGDEVAFHSSATAKTWRLQVYRDGLDPEMVHEVDSVDGCFAPTPPDAYRNGCGWPVRHGWKIGRAHG